MRILSPATSANLGPGFDCFGVAWQCYNEMEWLPGGEGLRIEGCPLPYRGPDNLAYAAYRAVLQAAGLAEEPLLLRFLRTEIPLSRGLGSSAALIAGGVLAADRLHRLGLSPQEMLALAARLEGYPDNVAPALLGGFALSAQAGEKVVSLRCPVHPVWRFAAIIPDFELSTARSRAVLPESVPRQDAVFNLSRAALLPQALAGEDPDLLRFALEDRLHQPYRRALIPGWEQALAAVQACGGLALCLSGAGSTLLCIARKEDFARRLQARLAEALPAWEVRPLQIDAQGAREENE